MPLPLPTSLETSLACTFLSCILSLIAPALPVPEAVPWLFLTFWDPFLSARGVAFPPDALIALRRLRRRWSSYLSVLSRFCWDRSSK